MSADAAAAKIEEKIKEGDEVEKGDDDDKKKSFSENLETFEDFLHDHNNIPGSIGETINNIETICDIFHGLSEAESFGDVIQTFVEAFFDYNGVHVDFDAIKEKISDWFDGSDSVDAANDAAEASTNENAEVEEAQGKGDTAGNEPKETKGFEDVPKEVDGVKNLNSDTSELKTTPNGDVTNPSDTGDSDPDGEQSPDTEKSPDAGADASNVVDTDAEIAQEVAEGLASSESIGWLAAL